MLYEGKLPAAGPPWRSAAAASLLALAVLAVGLRGASAQVEDKPPGPRPNKPADADTDANAFEVDLVPADAVVVVGIRPADILASPDLEALVKLVQRGGRVQGPFGVPLESIEQVVFSLRVDPGQRQPPVMGLRLGQLHFVGATVRVRGELDQKAVVAALAPEAETGFYGGQLYLKPQGRGGPAFWLLDERTFALAEDEAGVRRMVDARNTPGRIGRHVPGWESARHGTLAALLNVDLTRAAPGGKAARRGGAGVDAVFDPLWVETDAVAAQASLDGGLKLSLTFRADRTGSRPPELHAESARRIQATLDALVTTARSAVRQNRLMVEHLPEDDRAAARGLLALAESVLQAVEVERGENATVVVKADLDEGAVRGLVAALLPALEAARREARRVEAMSDLKQIAVALHSYHDAHGHFPPPVVLGPDGKTPHSWRVAILPFLEEQELLERYRLDEPWDGEHNKELLTEMPAVFRHPLDEEDSTDAGYFALTGPRTVFGTDVQGGVRIADIPDGTSNTLMVAEAKKSIPWTKPEDVPYDPQGELPKLGGWFDGGFLAVFADGASHFISDAVGEETLRFLIERDDGRVIPLPPDDARPVSDVPTFTPPVDLSVPGGEFRPPAAPRFGTPPTDPGSGARAAPAADPSGGGGPAAEPPRTPGR